MTRRGWVGGRRLGIEPIETSETALARGPFPFPSSFPGVPWAVRETVGLGLLAAVTGGVLNFEETIGEVADPAELLRVGGPDTFRAAKAGIEVGRRGAGMPGIGVALGDLARAESRKAIVAMDEVGDRGSIDIELRGVGRRVGRVSSSDVRAAILWLKSRRDF